MASNQPHTKRDSGGQDDGNKSGSDGGKNSQSQQHQGGNKDNKHGGVGKSSQHDQGDHDKSGDGKSHPGGS